MLQSKDILNVLRNDSAKSFIRQHLSDQISELGLKYSGKTSFNLTVCLQLLSIYQRASKKMPLVVDHLLAIDKRSYEQATAQRVTQYKAQFIRGDRLLDITAGWGMDALILSENFNRVVAVERNRDLHDLAEFNLEVLGIEKIQRLNDNGEAHIDSTYDWIYIDPDRRVGAQRGVKLSDMEPNVSELYPRLKEAGCKVYIKLSPLFDVEEAARVFPDAQSLFVISERGEVKELGVVLNFSNREPLQMVVHDVFTHFSFSAPFDRIREELALADGTEGFLHLAHAGLLKARLADPYLKMSDVKRHPAFPIYFSNDLIKQDGLRSFEVIERLSWSVKEIAKSLKNNDIRQINLVVKGSKEAPAAWHKKLKTSDGGEYYLFLLKHAEREAILARITA